jgi:flagellar biosynthesis regulator FlaF
MEFWSNSWPGSGASHMVINVYNGTNRYNPTLPANLISLHVLIHVHFENARKGTRGIECLKFDKNSTGTVSIKNSKMYKFLYCSVSATLVLFTRYFSNKLFDQKSALLKNRQK